ncbi:MAG: 50S ribosomal protein L11 methyltransferase [Vampirovibrionales bacterium]|nr:50S ribosomal protein L11 methyltransferase [Vampirovibrionales bacterium]
MASDIAQHALSGATYEWVLTQELQMSGEDSISQTVLLLEELLWGLEGVESIEQVFRPDKEDLLDYQEDGWSHLGHIEGLKVFSANKALGGDIEVLLAKTPELSQWTLSEARPIKHEDWAESWKAHWDVTPIHEALMICPSWLTCSPKTPDEKIMVLDPGVVFGSGTHETTCLMLQGLYQLSKTVDFSQCSVLDVGTGSGVLAIHAAQLGSKSVIGIDLDINSPHAALENAKRNQVDSFCTFSNTALDDLCHTKHEIMLANIIAPVIIALLPEMRKRLAGNGVLMLSGLIDQNLPAIERALDQEGFAIENIRSLGAWRALDIRFSGCSAKQ